MADHVNTYTPELKEEWLKQRGWVPVKRDEKTPTMWRDPDRGVSYNFNMAMKLAIEACRLPADFELRPK